MTKRCFICLDTVDEYYTTNPANEEQGLCQECCEISHAMAGFLEASRMMELARVELDKMKAQSDARRAANMAMMDNPEFKPASTELPDSIAHLDFDISTEE